MQQFILGMNRSATAVIAMTTQGTTNTQADMLQSSTVNTQQDKIYQDQNDFEDVFKNDGSGSTDKKDLRGENFMKKNFKALTKQKHIDIPNFISPKEIKQGKTLLSINGVSTEHDQDEVNEELQYNDINKILSPMGGYDQQINQRRQISMANAFGGAQQSQNSKALNLLNQTAPFVQTNSQNQIHEEDEQDSYYQDRQKKKLNGQESQIQEDIIQFDESQNDTKREEQSQSQMGQSQQQSVSTCLICFDATPDSIFNPCGHGGACYECAIDLMKKTGECYLCRQKIEEILKIDIESRNQGIMKIVSTTKMVKVREKIEISEQEYQYYSALRRNRRLQQQQFSGQNQHQQNNNNNNNQQQQQNQNQQQSSSNQPQNQNSQSNNNNNNSNSQNNGLNRNFGSNPFNNQANIFSQQNVDQNQNDSEQLNANLINQQ